MATVKQMEFFKSLYDGEMRRYIFLNDHAKNNLTLVTIYSAFMIFVVEKFKPTDFTSRSFFVLSIASMAISFLISLHATNVAIYEAVSNPADIIEKFGTNPPTDEEFFDARILDYTVAYERNAIVNTSKARWLTTARYMLLIGVFCHASYFIYRSWQQGA